MDEYLYSTTANFKIKHKNSKYVPIFSSLKVWLGFEFFVNLTSHKIGRKMKHLLWTFLQTLPIIILNYLVQSSSLLSNQEGILLFSVFKSLWILSSLIQIEDKLAKLFVMGVGFGLVKNKDTGVVSFKPHCKCLNLTRLIFFFQSSIMARWNMKEFLFLAFLRWNITAHTS